MSITSLVQKEILRNEQPALKQQRDQKIVDYVSESIAPNLDANSTQQASSITNGLIKLETPQSPEKTQDADVLNQLTRYIPTESITLYVAACSAMDALKSIFDFVTEERIYWLFAILTPILFLLIYAGKRRNNGLSPFPRLKNLPWWKLISSTIAFLGWALAIPNAPYLHGSSNTPNIAGGAIAAFIAILISTILSICEPIFEPRTT